MRPRQGLNLPRPRGLRWLIQYDQSGQNFTTWYNFNALGHFLKTYSVFGNFFNLLRQIFNATGQILTVVNGKILSK